MIVVDSTKIKENEYTFSFETLILTFSCFRKLTSSGLAPDCADK